MVAVEAKIGGGSQERKGEARHFSAPQSELHFFGLAPEGPAEKGAQQALLQNLAELTCPRCEGALDYRSDSLECGWCSSEFLSTDGIPRLFFPHDVLFGPRDVTQSVKGFFESRPTPVYEDSETRDSFRERMFKNRLASLLESHLPEESLILDAGCGTGHLANFLAMHKNRRVVGIDLSVPSLRMGKHFKERLGIAGAGFLQMNLFRPCFQEKSFDVVIANGVLPYTSDPFRGFTSLSKLLKPEGVLVIGLHNHLGRAFYRRRKQLGGQKHSFGEIFNHWFGANGFEFLYSMPMVGGTSLKADESLFVPRWTGSKSMRLRTELGMLVRGVVNDGTFVLIARKRSDPKQLPAPHTD